ADVTREVGGGADEPAEVDELVRAELVRLGLGGHVAQRSQVRVVAPEVGAVRATVPRADPILPVVGVCETAAGPAHYGGMDRPQRFDQRLADPADIRDAGALAHPHAVVDHAA